MISTLCAGDLKFEPGADYHYSNSGYNLLGYIIERIEGKPYSEVLNDRIFVRLDMLSSGYDDPRYVIKNLATGYQHRIWGIEKSRYYYPDLFHAAGSIFATADDLIRWTRALHTGKVVPDEYYNKMTTQYFNNYGYGIGSVKYPKPGDSGDSLTIISHSGGGIGFSTNLSYILDDEITIVILNNFNTNAIPDMRKGIINLLYGEEDTISPKRKLSRYLFQLEQKYSIDSAIQAYEAISESDTHNFDLGESQLNLLGYELMRVGHLSESRIIFEIALKHFPESANLYDSYAESCLANGDSTAAIVNYNKSLELNPDNGNALKMLKKIKGE